MKTLRTYLFVLIAMLLFASGMGESTPYANHHDNVVNANVAFTAQNHDDFQTINSSSKHEHPKNHDHQQGNCCHSFACAGGALYLASTIPHINPVGSRVSLLPATFAQGQPIPPFERPPKLSA
ncbi:MAG: hypothetical protein ACO3MW_09080 [Rhodospirillales bacterium]